MLVTESRPRNLKWTLAGPLLYGDWGTSRLYVLGLAFLATAHASVIYLAVIGLLMLAVAWAYTIVCRCFPDGGGVYTAARQLSPTLSVVGATLLLSGYIMTAAISVVEAFHYFGVPEALTLPLSVVTLILIGAINWYGAKSAGRFAFVIATAALAVSLLMAVLVAPFFVDGLRTVRFSYFTSHSPVDAWVAFTGICLALAGVEAVANMTGLMKQPVARTARRTIWPVTAEVVVLNMVFGLALAGLSYTVNGVPLAETHGTHADLIAELETGVVDGAVEPGALELVRAETAAYTNAAMKVVAREAGDHHFGGTAGFVLGKIAGITFGLLLLSATNTAVMAMVSVLFAMSQDRELPKALGRLNYSGVPWIGLIISIAVSAGVLAWTTDVSLLAKLYVLGVCGASTVTILSCAVNRRLDIGPRSRAAMWGLGGFLAAISVTIAVTQPVSTAFSGGLIVAVLGIRAVLSSGRRVAPKPIDEPTRGWLAEVKAGMIDIDPARPRLMLAARGRYQSEFAVDLARRRGGTLFAIFVRTLRVMDVQPGRIPRVEEDRDAQEALGTTALLAKQAGVPFVPIYVTSPNIAEEILDYTVTYGCDTLIMGKSRRTLFSRRLAGDVLAQVAEHLPDDVALITRSADTPHAPRPIPSDAG
jgi:amino acid transporter/nucleotide-binding universal stress UspA family protein